MPVIVIGVEPIIPFITPSEASSAIAVTMAEGGRSASGERRCGTSAETAGLTLMEGDLAGIVRSHAAMRRGDRAGPFRLGPWTFGPNARKTGAP
jgi:hypothetical protein